MPDLRQEVLKHCRYEIQLAQEALAKLPEGSDKVLGANAWAVRKAFLRNHEFGWGIGGGYSVEVEARGIYLLHLINGTSGDTEVIEFLDWHDVCGMIRENEKPVERAEPVPWDGKSDKAEITDALLIGLSVADVFKAGKLVYGDFGKYLEKTYKNSGGGNSHYSVDWLNKVIVGIPNGKSYELAYNKAAKLICERALETKKNKEAIRGRQKSVKYNELPNGQLTFL